MSCDFVLLLSCFVVVLWTQSLVSGLWQSLLALSEGGVWVRYGVSFETDEDDECKVWIIGAGRATQPPAAVMGSTTVSFWMFFPLWIYCNRLTCRMNKTKHLFSPKYRFWKPHGRPKMNENKEKMRSEIKPVANWLACEYNSINRLWQSDLFIKSRPQPDQAADTETH